MTKSVPPGRNTNDTGPRSVEHYITQANRQNLPYEAPMATFLRAKAAELNRHDAARIQQKMGGNKVTKQSLIIMEQECRDRQAMYHYEHHFTDMRGANTVKRANIVVKKVG